jgi:hypothetical protein
MEFNVLGLCYNLSVFQNIFKYLTTMNGIFHEDLHVELELGFKFEFAEYLWKQKFVDLKP